MFRDVEICAHGAIGRSDASEFFQRIGILGVASALRHSGHAYALLNTNEYVALQSEQSYRGSFTIRVISA